MSKNDKPKSDKPNILFIMSDDIGWFDLSCYNHGVMRYRTPNIDRIAQEGAMFTDRGEKDTNFEGGWRVPFVMRWPGVIKPGRVINDICSLQDLIPTFAAAAGEPDLVAKVKKGYTIDGKTFKVHLDGENLLPFLKGDVDKSPREGFLYWSDDGELLAIRVHEWKVVFLEQRAKGLDVWREPFAHMRVPKMYNLRADPFERGEEGLFYQKWMIDRAFLLVPAQAIATKCLESFKEFPIRQKPASFNLDEVVAAFMPHP